MESKIICKINKKGNHDFYVNHGGKDYYLFSQDYHRGVNILFSRGVPIDSALKYKTAKRDHCAAKTISKLKPYLKYVEKEYNLHILKESFEKGVRKKEKKFRKFKNELNYDLA